MGGDGWELLGWMVVIVVWGCCVGLCVCCVLSVCLYKRSQLPLMNPNPHHHTTHPPHPSTHTPPHPPTPNPPPIPNPPTTLTPPQQHPTTHNNTSPQPTQTINGPPPRKTTRWI